MMNSYEVQQSYDGEIWHRWETHDNRDDADSAYKWAIANFHPSALVRLVEHTPTVLTTGHATGSAYRYEG